MFQRTLNLNNLLKTRSFFLFGPRGSGKSTLIKNSLPQAKVYDLLHAQTFERLLRSPSLIAQESSAETIIVIDEIQKLPELLDEVHRLIFSRKQTFLLTGSSARKLRQGGVNLLAGRAFQSELFPLTSREIPQFDLITYINSTGLPEFYASPLCDEFLSSYVGTYLKEEIQSEALARNLSSFIRFLDVIALCNGEEINYNNIASDSGVPVRTLENYFSILTDTLLGFSVEPFLQTKKRKATTKAKFYLFDIGVVRYLTRRGRVEFKSELFGKAFEHFIALELRAYISYLRIKEPLQYWRSQGQDEVDFVIGQELAIEVKGTDLVQNKHLKGIRALKEEGLIKILGVVSCDENERMTEDGIFIWPYQIFLNKLWSGFFLSS